MVKTEVREIISAVARFTKEASSQAAPSVNQVQSKLEQSETPDLIKKLSSYLLMARGTAGRLHSFTGEKTPEAYILCHVHREISGSSERRH